MKLRIVLLAFVFSFAALAEYPILAIQRAHHEIMLPCSNGGTRVRMVYHTTDLGPNPTMINPSSYAEGLIEDQITDKIYFGISSFNDILGVQTLRDKDQKIVGANIYLSFCQYSPLIVEGRKLSDFRTPTWIILNESTGTCFNGDAITLTASLFAAEFGHYPATRVPTSFAPDKVLKACSGNSDITIQDGPRQNGQEIPSSNPVVSDNSNHAISR